LVIPLQLSSGQTLLKIMHPQLSVISVGVDLLNIGLQMQLRTRNAIILSKGRNFELRRNHNTRNKTQIIKIQPGHFQIFLSIQTVFELLVLVIFIRVLAIVRTLLSLFLRLTLTAFFMSFDTPFVLDTSFRELYPTNHFRTTFVTSAHVEKTHNLLLLVDELLQIFLALDQVGEHLLELSILSLEIFDSLFESHFSAKINSEKMRKPIFNVPVMQCYAMLCDVYANAM